MFIAFLSLFSFVPSLLAFTSTSLAMTTFKTSVARQMASARTTLPRAPPRFARSVSVQALKVAFKNSKGETTAVELSGQSNNGYTMNGASPAGGIFTNPQPALDAPRSSVDPETIEVPKTLCVSSDMYRQISGLFDKWNEALQTCDPDVVTKLYHNDATLLPTLSNKVRTNHAEIKEYFKGFLAKKPVGRIVERVILSTSPDRAVDVGLYVFSLEGGDNGKLEAPARYTFAYEKSPSGEWKIKYHHSSHQPEMVAEKGLVKQHLDKWFKALVQGGPQGNPPGDEDYDTRAARVAELYAPDAILLATVSPRVRVGRLDIADYMKFFTSLNPKGSIPKFTESCEQVQDPNSGINVGDDQAFLKVLGPTEASYSGLYNFEVDDGNGGRKVIGARFSFYYTRDPKTGKWLISEHHSSALPEKTA